MRDEQDGVALSAEAAQLLQRLVDQRTEQPHSAAAERTPGIGPVAAQPKLHPVADGQTLAELRPPAVRSPRICALRGTTCGLIVQYADSADLQGQGPAQ